MVRALICLRYCLAIPILGFCLWAQAQERLALTVSPPDQRFRFLPELHAPGERFQLFAENFRQAGINRRQIRRMIQRPAISINQRA